MTRRSAVLMAAGAVAASLLAGCHGGQQGSPTSTPTSSASTGSLDTTGSPTTAQPLGADLPPAAAVNLQIAHPDGITIHVTGVAFYEDNIQLKATVISGQSTDVVLSYLQDDLYLTDDTGIKYRLSPPPGNPKVTIAAKSTLQATLVFLGRIAPTASTLTLTTNASRDDITGVNSTNPTIRLTNIPVGRPGQSTGPTTTASAGSTSAPSSSTTAVPPTATTSGGAR